MIRIALVAALAGLLAACVVAPPGPPPHDKLKPWPSYGVSDPYDRYGWSNPRLPIVGDDGEPLTYHPQRGLQEHV